MRDGFSTSGTAGNGLGAIRRLADVFEIYSQPDQGTALLARIGDRPQLPTGVERSSSLEDRLGVICVPLRGEAECGDAWRIVLGPQRTCVLLVDGLGHGPGAAAAADIAITMFPRLASDSPEAMLMAMSSAMRDSRGAAVSVVVLDDAAQLARFAGVGNVDARVLVSAEAEYFVPQNGIIGHTLPAVRSTSVAWTAGAYLVMHSDGISARWRVDAYPGLCTAHPALIAGVIYRDFGRPRDDATVLVLRQRAAEERQ